MIHRGGAADGQRRRRDADRRDCHVVQEARSVAVGVIGGGECDCVDAGRDSEASGGVLGKTRRSRGNGIADLHPIHADGQRLRFAATLGRIELNGVGAGTQGDRLTDRSAGGVIRLQEGGLRALGSVGRSPGRGVGLNAAVAGERPSRSARIVSVSAAAAGLHRGLEAWVEEDVLTDRDDLGIRRVSSVLVGGRSSDRVGVQLCVGALAVDVIDRRWAAGDYLRRRAVAPVDRPAGDRVGVGFGGRQGQRIGSALVGCGGAADGERGGHDANRREHHVIQEARSVAIVVVGGGERNRVDAGRDGEAGGGVLGKARRSRGNGIADLRAIDADGQRLRRAATQGRFELNGVSAGTQGDRLADRSPRGRIGLQEGGLRALGSGGRSPGRAIGLNAAVAGERPGRSTRIISVSAAAGLRRGLEAWVEEDVLTDRDDLGIRRVSSVLVGGRSGDGVGVQLCVRARTVDVIDRRWAAGDYLRRRAVAPVDRPAGDRVGVGFGGRQGQRIGSALVGCGGATDGERGGHDANRREHHVIQEARSVAGVVVVGRGKCDCVDAGRDDEASGGVLGKIRRSRGNGIADLHAIHADGQRLYLTATLGRFELNGVGAGAARRPTG